MCERVTKKQRKVAATRARSLLKDVQKELKRDYKFSYKLVGSGSWNTIIKDKDGHYDLDYQIILTHNSRVYKQENGFVQPSVINLDFLRAFNKFKTEGERFQDSTTAITLVNKNNQPYSIDFVIIDGSPKSGKSLPGRLIPRQIIRRNIKKETQNKDEKTWNELRDVSRTYDYFNQLGPEEKQHIIENMVIPSKKKEKSKDENKVEVISSYEILIREILKYEQGNKREDR